MITFRCPNCGTEYELGEEYQGKKVACSVCDFRFYVPEHQIPQTTPVPVPVPQVVPNASSSQETEFQEMGTPAEPAFNEGPATWVTCPHCWQHFDLREIKYISRHPELQGDAILGEDAQLRFVPVKYSARGLAIDARGMECPEMACPNCHLPIPEAVVEQPSSIFSIVGAPSSGKSYFLTSMLWQARKILPNCFEFNLADVDSSFNMVVNSYEKLLFMNNRPDEPVALPKTELQGGGFTNQITMNGFPVDLPKPFVFAMTPMQGHPGYGKDSKNLQRNIILYDNAGEHFQPGQESVNNMATSHLSYSDGIIFIYDPLRDARMQKFCDKNDPQFQLESTNQLALFYEMSTRIRKFSNLSASEKYEQPLIVAVAKFDALEKKFNIPFKHDDFLCYDGETMEYSLDIQKITDISFQIRRKLLEIAPEFVSAAEGFSDNVYFVPVSAFGSAPQFISFDNDKNRPMLGIVPNDMKPKWIEVPLLLQLYLHGLINGSIKNLPSTTPVQNYKFTQDTIICTLPGTGVRCELPKVYWGMSVYCPESNCYCTIPEPEGFSRNVSCKAASLDEQIDNDFWNI
ncbi:MAG: hypothetical protein IKC89_00545 [Lentisphaeria bacterium]|nr:hypothetical protein [Lentisphaeria bacterium]